MKIQYSCIALFAFFLALNWELFMSQDVMGDVMGDVDGPPPTKEPKEPSWKKWAATWSSKANVSVDQIHSKYQNVSTNSTQWKNQMAKAGTKMNKFNLCMGSDFIKKCKIPLAVCAVVPIPQVCIFTMACGGFNIKKCYNQVWGNSTITTTVKPGVDIGIILPEAPPPPPVPEGGDAAMGEAR